jgi:hypothetical protein
MKKVCILFISLFSFFTNAQEKLISETQETFKKGKWIAHAKTEYTYDSKNNLISERVLHDFDQDGVFESSSSSYTYKYNEEGLRIESIEENGYKYEYKYDEEKLIETIITYNWENSTWINFDKQDVTYTDGKVDYVLTYKWINNDWSIEPSAKHYFMYSDKKLVSITNNIFENGSWIKEDKEEFTYDNLDRNVKLVYSIAEGDVFFKNGQGDCEYDSNDNLIKKEYSSFEDNDKELVEAWTYLYDNSKKMEDIIHPFRKGNEDRSSYPRESDYFINKILWKQLGNTLRFSYIYESMAIANIKEFHSINIAVFPNPTKDNVTISSNSSTIIEHVSVYNNIGSKVANFNTDSFSIKDLANGIYFLKIKTLDKDIVTKKIVKN